LNNTISTMPILFVYILKLSISLAVIYLFYRFVLCKLTFYTWNRWYLLGYSLLSFFIAFFNITPLFQEGLQHYRRAMRLVPVIDFYGVDISAGKTAVAVGQTDWNNWTVCLFILLAGVTVLSIRLVIQYFSFLNIRRKAKLLSENGPKVYHVEADIIPFSFGNSIFINKQLHSFDELQEIVRHEFVHVKQRHSIDILWSELVCIVSWYNPFSWLMKKAIRQNLEFIADNKVLESGVSKREYQYLLLKVIGNNHFCIASKFNFSSLKKRIAMMNKMRTARVHIVKFLFILPLMAVLLIAFRKKEHETNLKTLKLAPVPREISFSSRHIAYESDTTPKAKSDRKQMDDRGIDNFEITDKKALIHFRNGKKEEYDITDDEQRRKFEAKYGKIISLDANTDEAPVVTESREAVTTTRPVINATVAPATVTTNSETVASAKTVTSVNTSESAIVSTNPTKSVTVVGNTGYAVIADEDVLVTITKNTTAAQLEEFRTKMKEQGYELTFDKPSYNGTGTLTHISGTIKSKDGQTGNFSATDFDRVILARVQEDNGFYWRIDIVDKKKFVI